MTAAPAVEPDVIVSIAPTAVAGTTGDTAGCNTFATPFCTLPTHLGRSAASLAKAEALPHRRPWLPGPPDTG